MDVNLVVTVIIRALGVFAEQVEPPARELVGALLFQTPRFGDIGQLQQVWTTLLAIADTVFVIGLVIVGVLVMSAGTFQTAYTAKRLLPRVVLAAVMSNTSLAVTGTLTDLNNGLVATLVGPDPQGGMWSQLAQGLLSANLGIEALSAVATIDAAFLGLLLALVCLLRDLVLVVMIVVAPLALATYGVPQLEEVASLWWRLFLAALFVQVGQAVVVDAGQQVVAHVGWLGVPVTPLLDALVVDAVVIPILVLPLLALRWAVLGAAQIKVVRTLVAVAGG